MTIRVITEDSASGAQIIDGSLRFDGNSCLTRTFSSSGDRRTWTWSGWAKKSKIPTDNTNYALFGAYSDGSNRDVIRISGASQDSLEFQNGVSADYDSTTTTAKIKDIGWYHFVVSVDTDQATQGDRVKLYINGELQNLSASPQATRDTFTNHNVLHFIGARSTDGNPAVQWDGYMSQVYFVDGQQLAPTEFGFTDPLTNTWRPKKYTGTYGTNGFYLPMDGNSPIGEDKSGNGNNWTPVNFGGSNSIEKATGAFPILNTVNGGNVATVGVRTDANSSNLVLALPLVGNANDVSNQINSGSTTKSITVDGATATSTVSNFYGGSFDFDGSNDDLTWSITGGLGSGDFTIEYWVYQDTLSNYQTHFSSTRGSTGFNVGTDASGDFVWYDSNGGGSRKLEVVGAITTGRWYHWAFVRSGSTITGYLDGVEKGSFSSSVDYSASAFSLGALDGSGEHTNGKFSDARIYVGTAKYTQNFIPASTNPDILPDTPSGVAGGSALTKITDGSVSFDGNGDYLSVGSSSDFTFGTGDFTIEGYFYKFSTGNNDIFYDHRNAGGAQGLHPTLFHNGTSLIYWVNGSSQITTTEFPYNKWNHVALVRSSGSTKLYIDGVQKGSTYADSNDYVIPQTGAPYIGQVASDNYYHGFISNVRVVNGTALYTANFTPPSAPLTNVTNTKLLCCQSTTSATAAAVAPGSITANGDAAATNFNPFTTDINAVRGQETGYATLNPLASGQTLTNGNLTCGTSSSHAASKATLSMTSGKFYWEADAGTNWSNQPAVGVMTPGSKVGDQLDATGSRWYRYNGNRWYDGTDEGSAWGDSVSSDSGSVVGVAFDADNGTMEIYIDGISQGVAFTGLKTGQSPNLGSSTSDTWIPATKTYDGTININFGQKPFKFPPPDGFQPLNAANTRPVKVIARPDQYVGIATYQGSSSVNQIISATGTTLVNGNSNPPTFNPDLIWIADRVTSGGAKWIFDSVRGSDNFLQTNSTNGEGTRTFTINNNGVSIPAGDGSYNYDSTKPYVAWCWKAGGSSNTFNVDGVGYASASAAGLDGGTITPTGASVNTEAGFSILEYTGTGAVATLAHGLNDDVKFILIKRTNVNGNSWAVYHDALGPDKQLLLNSTNDYSDDSDGFNDRPSSGLIRLGSGAAMDTNQSGAHICYAWSEVPGFSKFGFYTGNGNADGPFVHCGFKPAWVMVKRTDQVSSEPWAIYDSVRDEAGNPNNKGIYANASGGDNDASGRYKDFLSNGFKVRGTSGEQNTSGGNYIFMAFAEAPTDNLYGGQANAR